MATDGKTGHEVCEWPCPLCDGQMVRKKSKFGEFWGCLKFPKCKGSRKLDNPQQEPPSESQKLQAVDGLTLALEFVRKVGGAQNARQWIGVVELALSLTPNPTGADEPEAPDE